jgi:hypothetical protein
MAMLNSQRVSSLFKRSSDFMTIYFEQLVDGPTPSQTNSYISILPILETPIGAVFNIQSVDDCTGF